MMIVSEITPAAEGPIHFFFWLFVMHVRAGSQIQSLGPVPQKLLYVTRSAAAALSHSDGRTLTRDSACYS